MSTSANATTSPALSLGIATFGEPARDDWRHLLDVARAADAAGIDRLVLSDHVVLGPNVADYPWGRFPTPPDGNWLEPLTTMAALAAVTERVRFLTGILIAPLRPAALLAKTAATLDVLSGGRIDLGVGVGWQREEFDAVGLEFADRGQLLDDTIATCRALWSGEPLDVTGPDGVASQVWSAPTPTQPRLPVWFSGTLTKRNIARISTLGDGWIPIMGASPDDVTTGVQTLRTAYEAAGRDGDELDVRASPALVRDGDGTVDVTATFAQAPALAAAGATDIHLPMGALLPGAAGDDADVLTDRLTQLVERFQASLGA